MRTRGCGLPFFITNPLCEIPEEDSQWPPLFSLGQVSKPANYPCVCLPSLAPGLRPMCKETRRLMQVPSKCKAGVPRLFTLLFRPHSPGAEGKSEPSIQRLQAIVPLSTRTSELKMLCLNHRLLGKGNLLLL